MRSGVRARKGVAMLLRPDVQQGVMERKDTHVLKTNLGESEVCIGVGFYKYIWAS